jgi:hypothetical protein
MTDDDPVFCDSAGVPLSHQREADLQARLLGFGEIELDGRRFDHDVVVEAGGIRRRNKGPSKPYREQFGHTPLSAAEAIPWSAKRLIVGTGASGQLPLTQDLHEEARRRGVEIVAVPTKEACGLLAAADLGEVAAVLHVTC